MQQQEKYSDLSENDPKITLAQCVKVFGSQAEVARVTNMKTRGGVQTWDNKRYIPPLHAYRLMAAYPNKFKQTKKGDNK